MRTDQLDRIDAAFERGIFDTLAGDHVTYVAPSGKEYPNLLCVLNNLKLENRPGLIVDEAGLRQQAVIELLFSKKRLTAAGVNLNVAGHWIIDDKRFDFAENEEILDKLNAVGGLHNLVSVRVRESAEINQTTPGAAWGYDLT